MATASSISFHLKILLCACLIYSSSVNSLRQEIFLFENPQNESNINYSAPYLNATENIQNVSAALVSWNARVMPNGKPNRTTGACTNGTWMVYSEPNYNGISLLTEMNTPTKPQCVNMSGTPIQSIRHAGHSDMDMPALSLYDKESMAKGRELYFEGYSLVLPSVMSFGSYGFTGILNWTLSPEVITDGNNNKCLELPEHNETQLAATNGNILTYKENVDLKVQEIRAGCGGMGQSVRPAYDITRFISAGNTTAKPMPKPEMGMNANSSGIKLSLRINNQNGTVFLIGTKLRLIEPLLLRNYTFTGPAQNWTIYSDIYATTEKGCLVYGSAAAEEITIGAIKMGCTKVASSASIFQFTGTMLFALFAYALLK